MVDAGKEQAGVWIEYDETTQFLIGSLSSKRYKQAYQEALTELRSKIRKPTQDEADAMQLKVLSSAVVLDWKGVNKDGAPFTCNPANVHFVLANCPQVREFVLQAAANIENFKVELTEEAKAVLGEASVTT